MKLKELFQAYEFDEIYPQIGLMFPKGRHLRVQFGNAYNLLLTLNPVASKKQIRYQLMEDPDTNEMFYGADDHDFNGPWEVLLGKEVKKEPKVDLTNEELVANCLLNTVLIGRHPRSFEKDYQAIVKQKVVDNLISNEWTGKRVDKLFDKKDSIPFNHFNLPTRFINQLISAYKYYY